MENESIGRIHPLRSLIRESIEFGIMNRSVKNKEAISYIEEEVLCGFVNTKNLYKIHNSDGKPLDDIADMLPEGDMLFNSQSFEREFQVHKHIGDYTLFMLGMFPSYLARKKGKEFLLGKIYIPSASLSEQYMLQGRRSYIIASEIEKEKVFAELAENFRLYLNLLELARIYLAATENNQKIKDIII